MGRISGPWADILAAATPAFTIAGETFVLPDHPAGVWIAALASDDFEAVVPGLLDPDDVGRWGDVFMAEDGDGDLLVDADTHAAIERHLIGEAGGMPWPAVLTLLGWASTGWHHVDAWFIRHGADPLEIPLNRLCNALYGLVWHGAKDEAARQVLDGQLFAPPPEADPADPATLPADWSAAAEGEMFRAALAQHQGGKQGRAPARR